MKGKIITGRAVILEDMQNQGLLSLRPVLPKKTEDSRYWRQRGIKKPLK